MYISSNILNCNSRATINTQVTSNLHAEYWPLVLCTSCEFNQHNVFQSKGGSFSLTLRHIPTLIFM